MTRTVLIAPEKGNAQRLEATKLSLKDLVIYEEAHKKPAIIGRAKVTSLGYEKTVFARVTFNDWETYRDYTASYLESCEENGERYDIFGFGFLRNDGSSKDGEFVLACVQNGVHYWDNNNERNYCFHLSEDLVAAESPDLFATNLETEKGNELILEECDYPHFQPHPLTPTKLRFYSTIRNAPEKEIVPAKAKNRKHMYAYNALAFECTLDLNENRSTEGPICSSVKKDEECCMAVGEESFIESSLAAVEQSMQEETGENPMEAEADDNRNPNEIQEALIEPEKVVERCDDEEDVFAKLENERQVNISTESKQEDVDEVGNEINENSAATQGELDIPVNQVKVCNEESCSKSTSEDHETDVVAEDSVSNQEDVQSASKEVIDTKDEENPRKKKKKSLFSKLFCGKAEN